MRKDSAVSQPKYVELDLFSAEEEDHQKDSISSGSKVNHTSPRQRVRLDRAVCKTFQINFPQSIPSIEEG